MGNDNGKNVRGAPGTGNSAEPDYSPDAVLARIKSGSQGGNSPTVRIPGWLALVIVAAIGAAIWFWYQGLGVSHIPLCVVNTASDAPLEILLDGKSIGRVSKMIGEDPNAALLAVLKCGQHELDARDGSGAVVASEKLTVEKGSNGFLWTPLPDPSFAFLIETTDYGESTGGAGQVMLEGAGPLRPLPEWVTQWFRENPKSVSAAKGSKRTHEHALRRAANSP